VEWPRSGWTKEPTPQFGRAVLLVIIQNRPKAHPHVSLFLSFPAETSCLWVLEFSWNFALFHIWINKYELLKYTRRGGVPLSHSCIRAGQQAKSWYFPSLQWIRPARWWKSRRETYDGKTSSLIFLHSLRTGTILPSACLSLNGLKFFRLFIFKKEMCKDGIRELKEVLRENSCCIASSLFGFCISWARKSEAHAGAGIHFLHGTIPFNNSILWHQTLKFYFHTQESTDDPNAWQCN